MKSLSQELLLIFILTGIGSLVPFAVYGEDFTFSDLLKQGNQGDANAQYKLGDMYMYGEGVAVIIPFLTGVKSRLLSY
jgi:hypothetical protein